MPLNCQIPDLPRLPSPAVIYKSGMALYLGRWLTGWFVDCKPRLDTNINLAYVDVKYNQSKYDSKQ